MIDIRLVRSDPASVRAALDRRGGGAGAVVDELRTLDEDSRALAQRRDAVRTEINQLSQQVSAARKKGDAGAAHELATRSRELGKSVKELDNAADDAASALRDLLLRTPNLPSADAPDGGSAADNPVLRVEGYDPDAYAAHQRVPHWEVGVDLGILDLERGDLWLIPTAEVPLTSIAAGEVLDAAALPQRLMAQTACFRREAGAAGRDTRGLLRVHEFDKVEILAYATAEQAPAMHAELLARAEGTLAALGLAYRVVDICTGDLGSSAARTFDLEVYAPGCDLWLEASSVSWFGDYQARRAGIRYRADGGNVIAHTLNGSALAVPRVWAAVVETYRTPDGGVAVPDALRPYFRGADRIA